MTRRGTVAQAGAACGRAPLRLSLAGGGTDLLAYSERFGGEVVSFTIDKHVEVVVETGAAAPRVGAAGTSRGREEEPDDPTRSLLDALWREVVATLAPSAPPASWGDAVRWHVRSDVPSGTGLGSSSALLVAAAEALTRAAGAPVTAGWLARAARAIERSRSPSGAGAQDTYAAAYGGLARYRFDGEAVVVEPLQVGPAAQVALSDTVLLFFTGRRRRAEQLLVPMARRLEGGDPDLVEALHRTKELAGRCAEALEAGDIPAVGALLHEGWRLKQRIEPAVTVAEVERAYERALDLGAWGGKLAGAGGGGFLFLMAPPEIHPTLREMAQAEGLRPFPVTLSGPRVDEAPTSGGLAG